jgi:hypothetical protein
MVAIGSAADMDGNDASTRGVENDPEPDKCEFRRTDSQSAIIFRHSGGASLLELAFNVLGGVIGH